MTSSEFTTLFAYVGGLFTHVLYEVVKRKFFSPRVRVESVPGRRGHEVDMNQEHGLDLIPARYIRASVENVGRDPVRDCRVYLTSIQEIAPDGSLLETDFHDSMRLRWAYELKDNVLHRGIDIPKGVIFYVDLLSAKDVPITIDADAEKRTEIAVEVANTTERNSARMQSIIQLMKTYRFTLVVSAANMDPTTHQIDIKTDSPFTNVRIV